MGYLKSTKNVAGIALVFFVVAVSLYFFVGRAVYAQQKKNEVSAALKEVTLYFQVMADAVVSAEHYCPDCFELAVQKMESIYGDGLGVYSANRINGLRYKFPLYLGGGSVYLDGLDGAASDYFSDIFLIDSAFRNLDVVRLHLRLYEIQNKLGIPLTSSKYGASENAKNQQEFDSVVKSRLDARMEISERAVEIAESKARLQEQHGQFLDLRDDTIASLRKLGEQKTP